MSTEEDYLYICHLCDKKLVTSYCEHCSKAMCKSCINSHNKFSKECREVHLVALVTVATYEQFCLTRTERDLHLLKSKHERELADKIQAYNDDKKFLMALCKQEHRDAIAAVNAHFSYQEEQINELNNLRIEREKTHSRERHKYELKLYHELASADTREVLLSRKNQRKMMKRSQLCFKQVLNFPNLDIYGFEVENFPTDLETLLASEAFSVSLSTGARLLTAEETHPHEDSDGAELCRLSLLGAMSGTARRAGADQAQAGPNETSWLDQDNGSKKKKRRSRHGRKGRH